METNHATKTPLVGAEEIIAAARRIAPFINRTPVLTSGTLNSIFGAEIFLKCENFQKVGAFKARGACNAVMSYQEHIPGKEFATHSSGNHAQALSWASRLLNTKAHIVMPLNSARIKVAAVEDYGGLITFCEPTLEARETTLAVVLEKTGAVEIHPYNNLQIIAGQATAAMELIDEAGPLDIILAPVGGGGLLSGTALSAFYFSTGCKVIAAEPEMADDAWQSFTRKEFVPSLHPSTLADGLRTSLGSITFPIILDHVNEVATVSEDSIVRAMRYIWERMKILIEPSSAVPIAALFENKVNKGAYNVSIAFGN